MAANGTLSAVTPPALPGQRIGLFGGSFNPAHAGHRAISLEALKRLDLDWIWWLVAPQNPLKDPSESTALDLRLQKARLVASHPRIRITGFEAAISSRYTADTVQAAGGFWPSTHFVWIMGADCLGELHRWQDWTDLVESIPIAVINRPGFGLRSLSSPAARRYARFRLDESDSGLLAGCAAPAWCFLKVRLRRESSTNIRTQNGK